MRSGKKIIPAFIILFYLVMPQKGIAQATWSFSAVKKTAQLVEVHLRASLPPGWHLYSTDSAYAPFPTKITFGQGSILHLKGALRETGKLDQADAGALRYFVGTAEFVQAVVVDAEKHSLSGNVQYVLCTDEQCMPPAKKEFVVSW